MLKLSIITINYNNLGGLKKTFESVFNQTWKDFEYIVIDGGSTDGSKELIVQNADKIDYWVSEPDKGIYNAMNKGIKVANGEYLLFLNSGDWLVADVILNKVYSELGDTDILYGFLNIIEKDRVWIKKYPSNLELHYFHYDTLPHSGGSFIKKKCFDRIGLYDEDLKIVSDWKWFLIAIFKYKVSYKCISEVIGNFEYGDGLSSKAENRLLRLNERRMTFEAEFKYFDYYFNLLSELKKENDSLKTQLRSKPIRYFLNIKRFIKKLV